MFGGCVDQAHTKAGVAQERGDDRKGQRRLGGPEHVLALLTTSLAREGHAIDERRIDQQRLTTQHVHLHHLTTVSGMARLGAVPSANGCATGSGDSSTLQQRRQTGKMPRSTSFRRISTYFGPFQISSRVDCDRSPTSTRMNGQKYTLPENDTRAWRNG